jgi:hypothetical protein
VEHGKQSQTEKGAVPCPQGILQGRFCESGRDGRFACYFIQLPQRLAANSLRTVDRKARSNGRECFADGREFAKLRRDSFTRSWGFTGDCHRLVPAVMTLGIVISSVILIVLFSVHIAGI